MSEISRLKRKARKLHLQMHNGYSSADCGAALMDFISHDLAAKQAEFEQIMCRLREIDPSFPKVSP